MKRNHNISQADVLAALSKVDDPELHQDLVSLNMIQNVKIEHGNVSFTVVLTTPACPLKHQIESEAKAAVSALPGVKSVQVNFDSIADDPSRGLIHLPIKYTIAIGSGKGGVGKSTVAVNLAVSLAQNGARVGLLDADVYGPNIPTMMGVDNQPEIVDEKIIPAEAHGVKLMSIGFFVKPNQPLIWRGPMLHTAIRQFLTDVNWGELDYLIVDLPPGTGDAALSLAQSLPLNGSVIVTLPQDVSLEDARRGLEMFRQLDVAVLGVVENMSYLDLPDGTRLDIFGAGGGERLAREAKVEFLGAIPIDPQVRQGGDAGKPVVISNPDSPVSFALRHISAKIGAKVARTAEHGKSFIPLNQIS